MRASVRFSRLRSLRGTVAAVALCAISSPGCGKGRPDVVDEREQKPTARSADATADDDDGAGSTGGDDAAAGGDDALARLPPPPKKEGLAADRQRFIKTLNEGRALTQAGDHAAGMAKYRQALEIDPADSAALAELGWAAFLAGEYDTAREHTARALRFADDPKQQGMLHYNLGRIAEALGEGERAADAYVRSLELRDNGTVRKRLIALTGQAPPERIDGPSGLEPVAKGLGGLAAACDILVTKVCQGDYGLDLDSCKCAPKLVDGAPDQSWGLLELAVSPTGTERGWYPAVRTDDGWTLFEIAAYEYNPGAFGIYEELEIPYQKVEGVLEGGKPALVVQFEKGRSDRDMGIEEVEYESSALTMICAREGKQAWCTQPLYRRFAYTREVESFGEQPDPDIDHGELPIKVRWNVTLGLDAGKVIVDGETPAEAAMRKKRPVFGLGALVPNGQHTLRELMRARPEPQPVITETTRIEAPANDETGTADEADQP